MAFGFDSEEQFDDYGPAPVGITQIHCPSGAMVVLKDGKALRCCGVREMVPEDFLAKVAPYGFTLDQFPTLEGLVEDYMENYSGVKEYSQFKKWERGGSVPCIGTWHGLKYNSPMEAALLAALLPVIIAAGEAILASPLEGYCSDYGALEEVRGGYLVPSLKKLQSFNDVTKKKPFVPKYKR